MIYVITEPCVGVCDTACVDVCPVDCIHGPLSLDEFRAVGDTERAARFSDLQLYIDPVECISCGACEPECPVDAIFIEDEVPTKWAAYIEKNAAFFKRRDDDA